MSYVTLEVEIDHGRVIAKEPSKLPDKASGLLIILTSENAQEAKLTQLEALEALQKHLNLDAEKAADWMGTVRDARGMDGAESEHLRARLKTFAEDWERPEASIYDEDRPGR